MLGIGEVLARRGHEITLCAPPGFSEAAAARGFAFAPIGQDIVSFNASHAGDVVSGSWRATRFLNTYFAEEMVAQFEQLPRALRAAELVVGGGAQFGASSVAEALGLPYHSICYTPCALHSREHAPIMIARQGLPPAVNLALWKALRFAYNRLMLRELNRQRRHLGLRPAKDFYLAFIGERPLLATDPEFIPVPPDAQPRPRQIGYPHPTSDDQLAPELVEFLESGSAPVYFGFGSMPDPDPDQTTRIFTTALRRTGRRAVISAGWAGFGAALASDNSVYVVGEVSHTALFPRMAAVVHHGGAGTTASSVYAGVPQVVVPHFGDQHYFAHQVHRRGLGALPVPRASLNSDRLATAVDQALGDSSIRRRAALVGNAVRGRHAPTLAADLITAERGFQ